MRNKKHDGKIILCYYMLNPLLLLFLGFASEESTVANHCIVYVFIEEGALFNRVRTGCK
jgi:hypothetical protein